MQQNERIWYWFDQGLICDVLRGQDLYFIPDATYREKHDLILAVRQLLGWAYQRDRVDEAAKAFSRCLFSLVSVGDLMTVLDIYMTYLLVAESDSKTLPIDTQRFERSVGAMITKKSREISEDEYLRDIVLRFLEVSPEAKQQVGYTL